MCCSRRVPTGNFQFTQIFTAGLSAAGTPVANTGNSFASFLLGQVTRFSIDAQSEVLKPRATIAEFFIQDDWRATRRLTVNLGRPLHAELPVDRRRRSGRGLQSADAAARLLRPERLSAHAPAIWRRGTSDRALGLAFKLTDSFVVRSGYSLTWIEQAGITTPFTTPLFPFIQTLGQQTLDNINPAFVLSQGPTVAAAAAGSGCGPGPGRIRRAAGQRQRLRAAVEPQPAEDVRRELELRGRLPGLEAYASGRARHQPESAHGGATGARLAADAAGRRIRTSARSRRTHRSARPRSPRAQLAAAISAVHHGDAVPQQHRPLDLSFVPVAHGEALLARADVQRRLHVLAADRRCGRGVRFGRADRAGRELSGRGQLQQAAGEGRLDRQHPAYFRQRVRVRTCRLAAAARIR